LKFPDEIVISPVVAVNAEEPAAITERSPRVIALFIAVVTVFPAPVVLIPWAPNTFRIPPTGVADPESDWNVVGTEEPAERVIFGEE